MNPDCAAITGLPKVAPSYSTIEIEHSRPFSNVPIKNVADTIFILFYAFLAISRVHFIPCLSSVSATCDLIIVAFIVSGIIVMLFLFRTKALKFSFFQDV
jgi:hypothetical protein